VIVSCHHLFPCIDDGGTIFFTAGTYNVNIVIDTPGKSFSLVALEGPTTTILDGGATTSVVRIVDSHDHLISLEGFTIRNGDSRSTTEVGGGMQVASSSIVVSNCVITNNRSCFGGGMYIQYSAAEILNCTFSNNQSSPASGNHHAGAIYNYGSSPFISNCLFSGNTVQDYGYAGAIYNNEGSSPTIINSIFDNNYGYHGGAIASDDNSSPVVSDCTFTNNEGYFGAAMFNRYGSEPAITNCTFISNKAEGWGGAIYNINDSDDDPTLPTIIGCTFYLNEVSEKGGAIANNNSSPEIIDCSFTENSAYNGGAIFNTDSSPRITGCAFIENMASYGAGIRSENMSDIAISQCLFDSNAATGFGGAMYNYDDTSVSVQNSFFVKNSAQYGAGIYNNDTYIVNVGKTVFNGNDANYGGAIYITQSYYMAATNCIFNGNVADYGGAIDFGQHTMGVFRNCTFYDNEALTGGAIRYLTTRLFYVTNCILWNNGDEISDYFTNDSVIVTYSDVQGDWPGEGNINTDPLFVNAPFDLSLQSISPCIDAGTDTSDPQYIGIGGVTDDIEDTPRPQKAGYDLGAYEYAGSSWSPVSIMPLARTQLANATDAWNELSTQLPEELTEEMTSLVEGIQGHMQNATGLTNPVYASGELSRALAQMDELYMLISYG
jgi:predicted outer membrane repeat protein